MAIGAAGDAAVAAGALMPLRMNTVLLIYSNAV